MSHQCERSVKSKPNTALQQIQPNLRRTMHCRAILVLMLVKIGATTAEDPLPSKDELDRYYVHEITLPYKPSKTESQKLEECHKLDSVHVFPPDLTEDKICERIVKLNDWMSKQIEAASEKVRGFYEKAYDLDALWQQFEKEATDDFRDFGLAQQRQRDKLMDTMNDAEKKELAQLIERISEKVDEDPVLSAHRYFHSPQRVMEDMAKSHASN